MFALIIGINSYKKITRLRGAVADARAIEHYVKDKLKVQDSHIRLLLDEDASRQNIIDALIGLKENKDIRRGDAILIYFAGHGQEIDAPEFWPTGNVDGKIQSIVPQDFDRVGGTHVIPDLTLGSLIDGIYAKKGDNITVILDSCFSGSGTRNEDPDRLARTALLEDYTIPSRLDIEFWDTPRNHDSRVIPPSRRFFSDAFSSHVLLAACSAKELARETNGRGQFTLALENVLKTVSPDQLTYIQLLDRLENIVAQNPQLEGNNRDRYIFNAKARAPVRYSYKIHSESPGKYTLFAGAADGVCHGAEYTVYEDHDSIFEEPPLSVMVVTDIEPFKTHVKPVSGPAPRLKKPALAVQTRAGAQEELRIYLSLKEDLFPAFDALLLQMREPGINPYRIALVEDRSVAHLEVHRHGDRIAFLIIDDRVKSHGLLECIDRVDADPEDLRPVLQGAAHYYYHLNRAYLNNQSIQTHLKVEFLKLEDTGDVREGGSIVRRPIGENLIKDGAIFLDVDENVTDLYGIQITNNWVTGLYLNVFYFDCSELSIKSYYKSGASTKFKVDFPLPPHGQGTLRLGFGDGGVLAFEYFIPEGRDVDVGFIKCIFTTEPIDLSKVPQTSAFNMGRGTRFHEDKILGAWGSILIPVYQRRV
ncbi:hypothetical protein GALMADRAFT_77119 [Galerina marginata CBS 339.88]|uniref:Peptidase C14 caspase domain-containing protein n=1 Tax=Galerina marginata (strain CBS 339.88) TaxID=685588 RepID=A0A067SSL3_GALM3|nr:hypothetical protein GALMADRAFT_77119 [Galerina marginata CBS 339.88]